MGMVNATPRLPYPQEWPSSHLLCEPQHQTGKSRPHKDSIPGPSSPQYVAIPTELSRSTHPPGVSVTQAYGYKCRRGLYLYLRGVTVQNSRALWLYVQCFCPVCGLYRVRNSVEIFPCDLCLSWIFWVRPSKWHNVTWTLTTNRFLLINHPTTDRCTI